MAYPNLAAEMTRMGITQKDAADRVGVTPETFSRWLTGKGSMPLGKAFELRDKMFEGMELEYLFGTEPQRGPSEN